MHYKKVAASSRATAATEMELILGWKKAGRKDLFQIRGKQIFFSEGPADFRVFTPAFVCNFPVLSFTKESLKLFLSVARKFPVKIEAVQYSLHLQFDGTPEQAEFRDCMDYLDDCLLDTVAANPGVVNKPLHTREMISGLQNRLFQPRFSTDKTQRYKDSMQVKQQAISFDVGVKHTPDTAIIRKFLAFNEDGSEKIDASTVKSGDEVDVMLLYAGPYLLNTGMFGNKFALVAVRKISDATFSQAYEVPEEEVVFPALTAPPPKRKAEEDPEPTKRLKATAPPSPTRLSPIFLSK